MKEFDHYRLWILIGVGLMSVFLLVMVWRFYYYNHRNRTKAKDYGLIFLSAGIGMWAVLAIMKLSFPDARDETAFELAVHTLSMVNNAFLLSSIPFFEHAKFLDARQSLKKNWTTISMVSGLVVLVIIYFVGFLGDHKTVANILDFGFTAFIFLILGGILFRTFSNRLLTSVGYLSLLVMFMNVSSQFVIAFKDDESGIISSRLAGIGFIIGGISFSMLIVILVALAFTWILDENEVFESWSNENTAREFWEPFRGRWLAGFEALKNELAAGLTVLLYEKARTFFNKDLHPPGFQMTEFEDRIILLTARYNDACKSYSNGIMSESQYNIEVAHCRENLLSWINDMIAALNDNQAQV